MYSDYIREFFKFNTYSSNSGIVNEVVYNEEQKVICVFVDLSVRELLENNKTFVKDIVELTRKCNVKVIYCDNIFNRVSTDGYKVVYRREDKRNLKSTFIDRIVNHYRCMMEFVYSNMYGCVLEEAYEILFSSMYMVLESSIKGYKLPVHSLNLLYDDFKKTSDCSKFKFLSRMIPYIEYVKDVDAYSDFINARYPFADISKEEVCVLVREITSFCCNCINMVFSIVF